MGLRLTLYKKRQRWKRALNRFVNGSCTVLLYHRIHKSAYDPQRLCVSPENFRAQVRWLKDHFKILTVEEFDACLKLGRFPGKSALLTFDDGYADNLYEALPILEETGLQALFYIATANINSDRLFWWDELDLIFKKEVDTQYLASLLQKRNLPNKNSLYEFFLNHLKKASSLGVRDELMNEIRPLRPLTDDEKKEYLTLTSEELKRFSASPRVVIGAHTVNHLSLGALMRSEQSAEMQRSAKYLEDLLHKKMRHFSYPYGEAHDFNSDTIDLSSKLAFVHAAANYSGIVARGADCFAFPRVVVRDGGPDQLRVSIDAAK